MKKHMTQGEVIRTTRMVQNGITDISEIQKHVFCDASRIQLVIDKVKRNSKAAPEVEAKPQGAAAKAAAKVAAKKAKVDPLT